MNVVSDEVEERHPAACNNTATYLVEWFEAGLVFDITVHARNVLLVFRKGSIIGGVPLARGRRRTERCANAK